MVVHNQVDSIGVCSDCYAEIKPKVTAAFPVSAVSAPASAPAAPSANRVTAVTECLTTLTRLALTHPKIVYENFESLKKTNGDVVATLLAENPQFAILKTLSPSA